MNKTKFELRLENSVLNKLNTYLITDSIRELYSNLDTFLKRKNSHNVHFKLESTSSNHSISDSYSDINSRCDIDGSDDELMQNNDEHIEILKLRHINLSKSINSIMGRTSMNDTQKSLPKSIFLITGARGKGKSSFMSLIYQQLCLFKFVKFPNSPLLSQSTANAPISPLAKVKSPTVEPFYLFYFLKPGDHFLSILIDIIMKMRLKYLTKGKILKSLFLINKFKIKKFYSNLDCSYSLNNELFDKKSIIEQLHASLCLGPVTIFLDGLSEMDTNHTVKICDWLPTKFDSCKFVITLNRSSEHYADLVNTKSCIIHELNVFSNETDYRLMVAKILSNKNINSNEIDTDKNLLAKNVLYGKFISFLNELKLSNHYTNPLFIQMIAQEIFTFDKEIYKRNQVNMNIVSSNEHVIRHDSTEHHSKITNELSGNPYDKQALVSVNESNSTANHSVNIINSYIEEVSTLRGIMEKIIKRYINKKNNWSLDNTIPLSTGITFFD
jgi:hypothetical protein